MQKTIIRLHCSYICIKVCPFLTREKEFCLPVFLFPFVLRLLFLSDTGTESLGKSFKVYIFIDTHTYIYKHVHILVLV